MKQIASIDGCLNYEGVPTDGCSQLYVGDIEIIFQNVDAIQIYSKHENEYLVPFEEETRSTSPSPLELHEVGPSKKEEDEEVQLHEPHFLEGSLKLNEKKIQDSLRILPKSQALVSNSCWRATSLEETSFFEDMEKIQRAMCPIKGNFMSLLFDRNHLFELNELLHDAYLKNNEDNHKLAIQNEQLLEKLQDTCFSSYVPDCQMVYCLEDSHDMVDHEKCGNLNVLDVF